ncbi:MAG: redox-sensing transcriptional repressor Rex [Holophagales bacterium]|nr:redox-sensing transcriptional repressor Rex [Holophagales bacterium]
MSSASEISPLTLNRLSVYLRGLRALQRSGIDRISSLEMARRFRLSAAQIRKDLAQFGEFGIRGVGYEVATLRGKLEHLLGLDQEHRAVIVGAGNIGTALARFPGLDSPSFRVMGLLDNDPERIGETVGELTVEDSRHLTEVVARTEARLAILAVPVDAAQSNYDAVVEAGIEAVLNFAPVQLDEDPRCRVKNVDLLIFLEELAYFLR